MSAGKKGVFCINVQAKVSAVIGFEHSEKYSFMRTVVSRLNICCLQLIYYINTLDIL